MWRNYVIYVVFFQVHASCYVIVCFFSFHRDFEIERKDNKLVLVRSIAWGFGCDGCFLDRITDVEDFLPFECFFKEEISARIDAGCSTERIPRTHKYHTKL